MEPIRNTVKAIIIQDGKILLERIEKEGAEPFYILPGGKQLSGETFLQTLRRECREEIGAEVYPGELALIREYIGRNHEFALQDAEVHQVEYMFLAELRTLPNQSRATDEDYGQTAVEWIDLRDLSETNIYPRILKTAVGITGKILPPVYRGDTN